MIILRENMAQKDAKIKFLERELEEREHEMVTLRKVETDGAPGDRIHEIEMKIRELDAMVKGLIEEMLDQKALLENLSKRAEARVRPVQKPVQTPDQDQPREKAPVPPQVVMKAPRQPVPDENLDLIMQTDGTLKAEKRASSDYIVASSGYKSGTTAGQNRAPTNGTPEAGSGAGRGPPIIYAEEERSKGRKRNK